jgi:hypothetical protein
MLRISAYGERKAAFDFWIWSLVIWVFETTASQHRFLGIVKGNG